MQSVGLITKNAIGDNWIKIEESIRIHSIFISNLMYRSTDDSLNNSQSDRPIRCWSYQIIERRLTERSGNWELWVNLESLQTTDRRCLQNRFWIIVSFKIKLFFYVFVLRVCNCSGSGRSILTSVARYCKLL